MDGRSAVMHQALSGMSESESERETFELKKERGE